MQSGRTIVCSGNWLDCTLDTPHETRPCIGKTAENSSPSTAPAFPRCAEHKDAALCVIIIKIIKKTRLYRDINLGVLFNKSFPAVSACHDSIKLANSIISLRPYFTVSSEKSSKKLVVGRRSQSSFFAGQDFSWKSFLFRIFLERFLFSFFFSLGFI